MSVPKKSFLGRPAPATARAPSASPASRPSPQPAVTTRNPGPGQTWFNLTRKDVERMSWEQLGEKTGKSYQQPPGSAGRSLWQKLVGLFIRSNKGN